MPFIKTGETIVINMPIQDMRIEKVIRINKIHEKQSSFSNTYTRLALGRTFPSTKALKSFVGNSRKYPNNLQAQDAFRINSYPLKSSIKSIINELCATTATEAILYTHYLLRPLITMQKKKNKKKKKQNPIRGETKIGITYAN